MCSSLGATDATTVTFVPATRRAFSERGFNAAERLARGVARELGLPCRALMRTTRQTRDQAGLGRAERAVNLAGAFEARASGGRILLVDDVITTGATAAECTRALRAGGADEVEVLTFAMAL
jgi:predicted amidophosphoribosyltransferase